MKVAENDAEEEDKKRRIEKLQSKLLKLEDEIKKHIELEQIRKEHEIIEKMKRNPRAFYSYANRHRKIKCKIGPLIDFIGSSIITSKILISYEVGLRLVDIID